MVFIKNEDTVMTSTIKPAPGAPVEEEKKTNTGGGGTSFYANGKIAPK